MHMETTTDKKTLTALEVVTKQPFNRFDVTPRSYRSPNGAAEYRVCKDRWLAWWREKKR